jgi:predicted phosphodiesterase
MRIAVISDTHFGDPMCTLVEQGGNGKITKGPKYGDFKAAVGKQNDHLILLGDILDFSIASYQEAYNCAKAFFLWVQEDEIAKEMIFVPGNHDADLWHIVEHQVNIINRIEGGRPPRPFRMSVPGIIDDRKGSNVPGFTLAGVTAKFNQKGPKYAGLFLDQITVTEIDGEKKGEPIPFNFAYPNVYLVTDEESVLITHGHYLETYWALAGEWSMKIAQEDLKIGGALDLMELVGINFPLSQLACSGIGQAGPLTKVIRQVQRDVKDGNPKRIKKYLNRLDHEVDKLTRFPWYKQYLEWLTDAASNAIKKLVLELIEDIQGTRYSDEFIHKKEVQARFMNFYGASLLEIDLLNRNYDYNIPVPWYVIFGHTHQPTPWGDQNAPKTKPSPEVGMRPITLYNTGGWLNRVNENKEIEFCGAEVFVYESKKGFKSTSIR